MLIKRTERERVAARLPPRSQQPIAGARPPHASCAARASPPAGSPRSARCRSAACARPRPGRRPRAGAAVTMTQERSAPTARSAAPSSPKWRTACGSARSRAGTARSTAARIAPRAPSVRELVHGDRRLKYPMKLVNGQWTRIVLGPGDQRDRRQADWRSARSRDRIRSTGSARPSSPTRAPISTASSRRSGAPTTSTTRRASAIRPPSPA